MASDPRREALKRTAAAAIDAAAADLLRLAEQIHAEPELAFHETRASAWLAELLIANGFATQRPAFGLPTAVRAEAGRGGPTVAFIAEYDALPDLGHACGHNVIAAAAVGAGIGASAVLGDTGGRVLVLGAPAEERGGGKVLMAEAGAFADVDAAMMIHPSSTDLPAMRTLAVSHLRVEYRGRPAHAAAFPERGINALDALVLGYTAIGKLRQHLQAEERIHGIITAGGSAPNIVPDHTAGEFYVRAAASVQLEPLKERALACFRAGALATGAQVDFQWIGPDYTELATNEPLAEAFMANAAAYGRVFPALSTVPGQAPGSTDMGNVSQLVPSIHPMLAIAPPAVTIHTPEFARFAVGPTAARAVVDGARAMAFTAIDVLVDADLRRAMRATFRGGPS